MPAMIFSLRVVVDLLRCVMYSTPLRQAFMQAIRDRRFDDAIMHYKQAQDRTLLSERFNGYCPLNSAIKNDNEKLYNKLIKKDKITIPNALKLDFKFRICFVEIIKPANIQNCVRKIIGIIKSGVTAKNLSSPGACA